MSKTNSIKLILFVLLLPLFLTGCYDRFELDNLAYVIALGADLGSGEQLNITYQIAIPVKITGESTSTGEETFTTYTVSAPSLSVANTLLTTRVSKGINLSHVKLIVYSEELARENIAGHVNVFVSDTNIRPRVAVVVCKNQAKEFLETISPQLESSPSRYYELLFSTYQYTTQSEVTQLIDLYSSMKCIDRNAFITYVELTEKKQIVISGIALLKGTKVIDVIQDESLLLAHSIITNNLKQSGYAIPDFEEEGKMISVRLIQNSPPKIKVSFSGDIPHISCTIPLQAHLVSSGNNINFYNNENESLLKEKLDQSLKEELSRFLEIIIKQYGVDVASFGKYAKKNFLTWNEFENYHWLEKFSNAEFDVTLQTNINISQIISHIVPNTSK